MLTQCPNCDTAFRVTSEILRVAGGQVRCGRCETQFDALERLIEEEEELAEEEEGTAEEDMSLSEPDLDTGDEEFIEEEQEDYVEARRSGASRQVARAEAGEEWVEFDDLESQTEAETLEPDVDDEMVTDPGELEEETVGEVEPDEDEEDVEEEAVSNYSLRNQRPPPPRQMGRVGKTALDDQFDLSMPAPRSAPEPAFWKYLPIPLGVMLLIQVVNHYSAPLARHPRLGPTVSAVYRVLGINLIPDWKLRAYEVKRRGVANNPALPGTLNVRASIRNRAPFPQPYPMLKMVLEDRYGGLVRAREFEPIEYLSKPVPPNARLAPQQEVNATLVIVDPGKDAEGYRFDACLQGNNGSVCSEDVPEER